MADTNTILCYTSAAADDCALQVLNRFLRNHFWCSVHLISDKIYKYKQVIGVNDLLHKTITLTMNMQPLSLQNRGRIEC